MTSAIYGIGASGGQIDDSFTSASTTWSSQRISLINLGNVQIGSNALLGDLTLTGDLTVQGTTTIIDSETVSMKDNALELNKDRAALGTGGMVLLRAVGQASMTFSEADGSWSSFLDGSPTPLVASRSILDDGSTVAPSLTFANSLGTGVFLNSFAGPDVLGFTTGGTEILNLDATAGASLQRPLHVLGGTTALPAVTGSDLDTGLSFLADTVILSAAGSAAVTSTLANTTLSGTLNTGGTVTVAGGGRVLAPNGTQGVPAYSFSSDPDTGVYRGVGANSVCLTSAGVCTLEVEPGTVKVSATLLVDTLTELSNGAGVSIEGAKIENGLIEVGAGTTGLPAYSFSADSDTGIYSAGVNALGLSCGGGSVLVVAPGICNIGPSTEFSNSVTVLGQILASAGTVALPGVSLTGDPNTGIYAPGPDSLGISCGGVAQLVATTSSVVIGPRTDFLAGLTVVGQTLMSAGTLALPGLAVLGDTNTGLYAPAANQLAISCGGVLSCTATAVGFTMSTPIGAVAGSTTSPGVELPCATGSAGLWSTGNTVLLSAGDHTNALSVHANLGTYSRGDFQPETSGLERLGLSTRRWSEVWCSQASINTASDLRMKHAIQPATLGLSFVNSLAPKTFIMNDTIDYDLETGVEKSRIVHTRRHEGLVAQEVLAAITAEGLTTAETDLVGIDEHPDFEDGMHSVRYGSLVIPLIKAVQELSAENTALQAALSELTARVELLEL